MEDLREKARKSLNALYLEVDAAVAEDVDFNVTKYTEQLQSENKRLMEENERLKEALKPFARFHCDDDSCSCYNCIAHRLTTQQNR